MRRFPERAQGVSSLAPKCGKLKLPRPRQMCVGRVARMPPPACMSLHPTLPTPPSFPSLEQAEHGWAFRWVSLPRMAAAGTPTPPRNTPTTPRTRTPARPEPDRAGNPAHTRLAYSPSVTSTATPPPSPGVHRGVGGGMPGARRPRVLYLHGFEEHSESVKPSAIRDHDKYDFTFVNLGMYVTKRHSPILYGMLGNRVGLGCLGLGTAGGLATSNIGVGLLVYVLLLVAARHSLLARGITGSYEATLKQAQEAVERVKPDVVVGFSWGGALAVELLARYPNLRALLLAPAYHKLYGMMHRTPATRIATEAPVCILHSDDDPIVPLGDSERLVSAFSNVSLRRVQGQAHRLWGTVETGELTDALDSVLSESQEG